MDAKRMVTAVVVGAITLFATGYLFFTMLLGGFYAANAGSAIGVNRESQIIWSVVLGNLGYAALISYALGNRADTISLGKGAVVGAVVGFLLWFTVDFVFYGISNMSNLTLTVVDPLVELVHGGIGGAVIGAVLARMGVPRTAPGYAHA
jgi:hypothetical protein